MNAPDKPKPLSYRDAGVDIDAGNALVERIKGSVASTHRPGVMGQIGGFGGLFELPLDRYRHPLLVSGTDGVGTKLRLAIEMDRHDTIGIDLVAMCVNDIIVCGAEPLFFLDYFATGQLNVEQGAQIVEGIAEGCRQSGAALIGGETAEMPGMYGQGDYDLAGFAVGIVERDEMISGKACHEGDTLVGIASSGPHSNGYSLIRKVLARSGDSLDSALGDKTLGQALLAPTRIYANALRRLMHAVPVRAVAHITGGGLTENLPRVLPDAFSARIDPGSWVAPDVFEWLQNAGNIETEEMWRTFNCGIGMVVIVPSAEADTAVAVLKETESAWRIGELITSDADSPRVQFG